MTDIDWSKAPEGATHYFEMAVQPDRAWRRKVGEEWGGWNPSREQWEPVHPRPEQYIERPISWDGTGLPPVGTVCEYKHVHEWQKVEVFAVKPNYNGSQTALFTYENGTWCGCAEPSFFRPIRTPEQIAAEEREAEIREIERVCTDAEQTGISYAMGLYLAGYRKVQP